MKKLPVFQNIHMVSTSRLYCNRSMCFCISSCYDTAGKNISWPQDKGGRELKKAKINKWHCPVPSSRPPQMLFSFPCSFFTFTICTWMCSRLWWAQGPQHQSSSLVKHHLQHEQRSSSQRTWRPLPRVATDPGNGLLYIRWRKKSNQFYYCEISIKAEVVFLFLLTGTKQDRGIINGAFFFFQRGDRA